jgi:predicted helicase
MRNLFGSEIRALRWASDRIKDRGVICFVTNGNFIDKSYADGLRKCLVDEFTSIYCFNLKGDMRVSNWKEEGGQIFGSGSQAGIAIIILIKNPDKSPENKVNYHDIGDCLSREQKLITLRNFIDISAIQWKALTPNKNYDWINQRNDIFESFISLGDKKNKSSPTIFDLYSLGVSTNRDAWVYNFSRQLVIDNMTKMVNFYNDQVERFKALKEKKSVDSFINTDPQKISWSRGLKQKLEKGNNYELEDCLRISGYRPYTKEYLYFSNDFIEAIGKSKLFFLNQELENLVICAVGSGAQKEFSALITDAIPNLHFQHTGQCFPLYSYEKQEKTDQTSLFTETEGYTRKENIPDSILIDFQNTYTDRTLTKEDIFYYVYGILHSPEYKTRFAADLKKMLPRIPYAEDFWAFSKAGKELAYWHLNYETIEPYPLNEYQDLLYLDEKEYRVEKMIFGKRNKDKTMIIYNSHINLSDIPLEAYEYIVNGKSAIEWIMERYQITKDKDSGIVNDPNDWSDDPRYIIDLVKRIVRVSLETVKIVNSLPPLNERSPS